MQTLLLEQGNPDPAFLSSLRPQRASPAQRAPHVPFQAQSPHPLTLLAAQEGYESDLFTAIPKPRVLAAADHSVPSPASTQQRRNKPHCEETQLQTYSVTDALALELPLH